MPSAKLVLASFVVCVLVASSGFAAPQASARGVPVPVSPGAERRPSVTEACPAFNWAPIDGAAGYELAVYRWLETAELSSEPLLKTRVPARAAGWTPAATECLPADGTYLWFVRELDVVGPCWLTGTVTCVTRPRGAGDDTSIALETAEGPRTFTAETGAPASSEIVSAATAAWTTRRPISLLVERRDDGAAAIGFRLCRDA